MSDGILVINAGSSSIKFTVFLSNDTDLDVVFRGQLEGIGVGTQPHFTASDKAGTRIAEEDWPAVGLDAREAVMSRLIDWINAHLGNAKLVAAGHRVVHGSTKYSKPVEISEAVLDDLRRYVPLAPLHQPHNISPIETLRKLYPSLPQVGVFDTAFHSTKRREAQIFAIPREYQDEGVLRYGFHGISYEYIAHKLPEVAPDIANKRVVVAHLGSGASLCGMLNGKCVDTTMSFSPTDGLVMGTRTGSLDPGVILYLMRQKGFDLDRLESFVNKEAGLIGVSGGISTDMRNLLASDKPEAAEAINLFCYRVAQLIGAMAMSIGGIDALVFTAGIGEHSGPVRAKVCDLVSWLGIDFDPAANDRKAELLSRPGSKVKVMIVPTNEELMIARHTANLVQH